MREMRRLERRLHEKERDLRPVQGRRGSSQSALAAFFPLTNIRGIEINAFAVALARVTLWMAHKLAVDELDLDEATLPLEDLSGIQAGDALRTRWPRASVIVGNPPFHGDRNLRGLLGDDYIDWLKEEFGCGVKDHCVYWFRKAHDHLAPEQRAGLVGTNSVSQNRARSASLNYVVEHGGVITDAVSTQDWPGEANVDVSIVNWIREPDAPPEHFVLDEQQVPGIDTALTPSTIPLVAAVRRRCEGGDRRACSRDLRESRRAVSRASDRSDRAVQPRRRRRLRCNSAVPTPRSTSPSRRRTDGMRRLSTTSTNATAGSSS